MAGFYIKQVTAISAVHGSSSVTFGPGLNIIQGRSDSGKSCVLNCIDFIYGGAVTNPFKESAKYDSVTMVVTSIDPAGDISLHRIVGKKQVIVTSNVSGIESGTYDVEYRKGSKNPPLNELWLKLLGIEGEPMVVTNARFDKKRLTWRHMLRFLYLDEDRVDQKESIVTPKSKYMENTYTLSALLYLISGRSFDQIDAKESKTIKKARWAAIRDFVNEKLRNAGERKKELERQLKIMEGADIEARILQTTAELKKIQVKIDTSMAESQKLLAAIWDAEARSAECEVLLNRFKRLHDQYHADMERIELILSGEAAVQSVPQKVMCPYCDNPITPKKRPSYIAASRAELLHIQAELSGLKETENDVQERKAEIQAELADLKEQRSRLEAEIQTILRPEADSLTNTIQDYKKYLMVVSEMTLIDTYSSDYGHDLDDLELEKQKDKGDDDGYHPKEYFPQDFVPIMSQYAQDILTECRYSNLVHGHFNFEEFDLDVNGDPKATGRGKGKRSYLNTVMVLMLRKYLIEHGTINPCVFIIDTPLHGLDEGVDESMPESMRTGLFRYLMTQKTGGQLIVVENLDHIPTLDYAASGAMVETFSKKMGEGERYGFLKGVTD